MVLACWILLLSLLSCGLTPLLEARRGGSARALQIFPDAFAAEEATSSAPDPVSVLIVPSDSASPSEFPTQLRAAAKHPGVSQASPVFGPVEATNLARMGELLLADSMKLEFSSSEEAAQFRRWVKAQAPSLRIDENPWVTSPQAAPSAEGASRPALPNPSSAQAIPTVVIDPAMERSRLDGVLHGLLDAVRSGARIIELPAGWSGISDSLMVRKLLRLARKRGSLIVAANPPAGVISGPCRFDEVICAGRDGNATGAIDTLSLLLAQGMDPSEATPRLLLSLRPDGSVGLAQALELSPQPLILPSSKSPVRVEWDRHSSAIPIRFELKNLWALGRDARVEISAVADQQVFHLTESTWQIDRWPTDESISFASQLEVQDRNLPATLAFEVRVRAEGMEEKTIRMNAVVVVPIGPETPALSQDTDEEISVFALEGKLSEISAQTRILTVRSESGEALPEYMMVRSDESERTLIHLVRQGEGHDAKLVTQGTLKLPVEGGTIERVQRSSSAGYVVITQENGFTKSIELDSDFQPGADLSAFAPQDIDPPDPRTPETRETPETARAPLAARAHLEPAGSCAPLDRSGSSETVFFCGDRLIAVPMN